MNTVISNKKADLTGPGIGDYNELERILPSDYRSLLTEKETQPQRATVGAFPTVGSLLPERTDGQSRSERDGLTVATS